jgi:hypothetical protein
MAPSHKPFICSCQEELRNKDDVDRHDKKWFELGHTKRCQFKDCDKVSPQTYNAKRHWKTHLPAELGKHFCKKCSTGYRKKHDLKKHEAADTCLYNRQKRPTKPEHDPGALILPNVLQNDRSIASANVSEPEPMLSRDLSEDISLPPASAAKISSTETSHSTQTHLGDFHFMDDPVEAWSGFTTAELDAILETISPDSQHLPLPQLAPSELELRDPDPSITTENMAFTPRPTSTLSGRNLCFTWPHGSVGGAPMSWSTSTSERWEPDCRILGNTTAWHSLQDPGTHASMYPSMDTPKHTSKSRSQRARLAAGIEMMVAKIRGLCRGDKSGIELASTTKREDKVACFSLPFRLRRSATPSTKKSVT